MLKLEYVSYVEVLYWDSFLTFLSWNRSTVNSPEKTPMKKLGKTSEQ
jgi:hypothetical protein